MKSLNIKGDKKSPSIVFEPYSGYLLIKGKSNLENPTKFYEPVIDWVNEYAEDPAIKTTLRIELEYFNSSSAKHIMKLFRILEEINKLPKKSVVVQWCYDGADHSMKESGDDFNSMLKLDFDFVHL